MTLSQYFCCRLSKNSQLDNYLTTSYFTNFDRLAKRNVLYSLFNIQCGILSLVPLQRKNTFGIATGVYKALELKPGKTLQTFSQLVVALVVTRLVFICLLVNICLLCLRRIPVLTGEIWFICVYMCATEKMIYQF